MNAPLEYKTTTALYMIDMLYRKARYDIMEVLYLIICVECIYWYRKEGPIINIISVKKNEEKTHRPMLPGGSYDIVMICLGETLGNI